MSVDYLSALNSKGSGLNITQIVDSLVQAETAPQKDLLQDKIDKRNTAISALATLSSELGNLKTSISGFAGTSKYTATSTSAGNTISVSNTSLATAFTSDVQVTALATPQTLEFSVTLHRHRNWQLDLFLSILAHGARMPQPLRATPAYPQ